MSNIEDKALSAAKEYADLILKKPLSELGGLLSDSIGYWRLKNRINLILKARDIIKNSGLNTNQIEPSVLIPILEEGSLTEDAALSDMFAGLLAKNLTKEEDVHPSYCKVLSQLSPLDASVVSEFSKYVSYEGAREVGLRGASPMVEYIARELDIDIKPCYLSCLNLWRLGLVDHQGFGFPENHPVASVFEDSSEHQKFRITEYGIQFLKACGVDKDA